MELVVKMSQPLGVLVNKNEISTAHRLRPKRVAKANEPPAITARLINRNLRNLIYSKRTAPRRVLEKDFPVPGMKNLFINENITQERKRLLWKTKELAKSTNYAYV